MKENSKMEIKDHGKRNEKLLESFDVNKEVLEEFKVENKEVIVAKKKIKPKAKVKKRKTIKPRPHKLNFKKKKEKKVKKIESNFSQDYPDKLKSINSLTKKYWHKFNPKVFPGEKTTMDINYMGVSTGSIEIEVKNNTIVSGEDTYFLNARLKTASYYSYLYELDDNVDSYVLTKDFLPVKYSLIQRESSQDIDDLQLFAIKKLKNFFFYKRFTKKSKKVKKRKGEAYLPERFQDPLSIIFFLRGLPMIKGQKYEVPIVNKEKIIMFRAKIVGVEKIKTAIGKRSAIKMIVTTKYTGDTLKSGDMTFWFSNDDKRIFLKFKAKIKIGSITGEIEKYELN